MNGLNRTSWSSLCLRTLRRLMDRKSHFLSKFPAQIQVRALKSIHYRNNNAQDLPSLTQLSLFQTGKTAWKLQKKSWSMRLGKGSIVWLIKAEYYEIWHRIFFPEVSLFLCEQSFSTMTVTLTFPSYFYQFT